MFGQFFNCCPQLTRGCGLINLYRVSFPVRRKRTEMLVTNCFIGQFLPDRDFQFIRMPPLKKCNIVVFK